MLDIDNITWCIQNCSSYVYADEARRELARLILACEKTDNTTTIPNTSKLRDVILEQKGKGNIVFMGIKGPMLANLDDFVKQPADSILHDLNRLPEVVLTFIDDSKWVNDYAVSVVITKLKAIIGELEAKVEMLGKMVNAVGDR